MTQPLTAAPLETPAAPGLVARPVPFSAIPRDAWDRLLAATPAATPFSRWTVHRAWWDAYGSTAHEQYLVCTGAGSDSPAEAAPADIRDTSATSDIRAILPLMHRHAVEPDDAISATVLRRTGPSGRLVPPDAKVIYMAASYHIDYATMLCQPADLAVAAAAVVESFASGATSSDPDHGDQPWDAIDLRRLRHADPARPALEEAFRAQLGRHGWDLCQEVEDVCPVASLQGADWEGYLASLDKKARHEIRRKMRRAEAAGEVTFSQSQPTPEAVAAFIELHQARWGRDGLFPDTAGGHRSRRFLERLAELEADEGDGRQLQLGQVTVGERVIFATVGFDDGTTCYFYNAGMDPDARALSPGVTGTAAYLRDRLQAGRQCFDFLRGDEPYKYEWGAVDQPIHRLLITRTADA